MKGLVLSGGGASGCFEGGVIYRLFDEIKFDKIVGTSVGGLNAILLAQAYVDGSPEIIKKVWLEEIENNNSVFNINYKNIISLKPPISFKPLSKLVTKLVDVKAIKEIDTEVVVTSVNLVSGRVVYTSSHDSHVKGRDFERAIISSASVPFFTMPVKLFGKVLVDGGIRENIPIKKMIIDEKINDILVVVTGPIEPAPIDASVAYGNPFKVLDRVLDIMMNEITLTDFKILELVNDLFITLGEKEARKIKYLNNKRIINTDIIMPKKKIVTELLEFERDSMKKGFEKGIEHAENYLKSIGHTGNYLKGKAHKKTPCVSFYSYD